AQRKARSATAEGRVISLLTVAIFKGPPSRNAIRNRRSDGVRGEVRTGSQVFSPWFTSGVGSKQQTKGSRPRCHSRPPWRRAPGKSSGWDVPGTPYPYDPPSGNSRQVIRSPLFRFPFRPTL